MTPAEYRALAARVETEEPTEAYAICRFARLDSRCQRDDFCHDAWHCAALRAMAVDAEAGA